MLFTVVACEFIVKWFRFCLGFIHIRTFLFFIECGQPFLLIPLDSLGYYPLLGTNIQNKRANAYGKAVNGTY